MVPKNGIYIIQGELNHVVAALRRNNRWSGGHFHQVHADKFDLLVFRRAQCEFYRSIVVNVRQILKESILIRKVV